MSGTPQDDTATRVASATRPRASTAADATETYVVRSPSLAVGSGEFDADPLNLPQGNARGRRARSTLLLMIWLLVSLTTIAVAAAVVALYF